LLTAIRLGAPKKSTQGCPFALATPLKPKEDKCILGRIWSGMQRKLSRY